MDSTTEQVIIPSQWHLQPLCSLIELRWLVRCTMLQGQATAACQEGEVAITRAAPIQIPHGEVIHHGARTNACVRRRRRGARARPRFTADTRTVITLQSPYNQKFAHATHNCMRPNMPRRRTCLARTRAPCCPPRPRRILEGPRILRGPAVRRPIGDLDDWARCSRHSPPLHACCQRLRARGIASRRPSSSSAKVVSPVARPSSSDRA